MIDNKGDFMRLYKEEIIFNQLKDVYFGGANYIKDVYADEDIDHNRVYRRIIKYRIKTFGTSFYPRPDEDYNMRERIIKSKKDKCKR